MTRFQRPTSSCHRKEATPVEHLSSLLTLHDVPHDDSFSIVQLKTIRHVLKDFSNIILRVREKFLSEKRKQPSGLDQISGSMRPKQSLTHIVNLLVTTHNNRLNKLINRTNRMVRLACHHL